MSDILFLYLLCLVPVHLSGRDLVAAGAEADPPVGAAVGRGEGHSGGEEHQAGCGPSRHILCRVACTV